MRRSTIELTTAAVFIALLSPVIVLVLVTTNVGACAVAGIGAGSFATLLGQWRHERLAAPTTAAETTS